MIPMNTRMDAAFPTYVAEVRNSRELALFGTADFDFWARKLHPEGLVPIDRDGRAEVMISAVASRWLGVRFSELVMAVVTEALPGEQDAPSFYLAAAYNSSRSFTFIEQRYFQTPYLHGEIDVRLTSDETQLKLRRRTGEKLKAAVGSLGTPPSQVDELWEGAIYLPPRSPGSRNKFYARLAGLTHVQPFLPGQDHLEIVPAVSSSPLAWLVESGVAGREWHVRSQANHARSKTYPR